MYFAVYSIFLLSNTMFCACISILQSRTCGEREREERKRCRSIPIRDLPNDCVLLVCVWGTPASDLAGNAICVLAALYFTSAISHPRMQCPCFKLQIFIFDFKARRVGSTYWGGDMDCLFFAVTKSRSIVNIAWYSDEYQQTSTPTEINSLKQK